jgi:trk system potassium uptake protein TrkA
VTDNDAVNILAAQIASRSGIRRKVARVRTLELWEPDALLTPEELQIDLLIRPEERTAQEIARLLKLRAGNVVVDVGDDQMQVVASRVERSSPLSRMSLMEISGKYDDFFFRIVAIARGIQTIIPGGDTVLEPHDHVFALVHSEDLPKLMEFAGVRQERRHRVLIIGGGLIGCRIAQLLEDTFPVRLVERDEGRAEELSYLLRSTEVLHGDGSDTETLLEAGLLDMDTIIAATGDNETNIMTTVLAKQRFHNLSGERRREAPKTIALVKREDYLVLASSMGADIVLNKKVLAANDILKYIRRGQMLSVAHLHGVDAEVVELVAAERAPITGKPLYKVGGMQDKIIIGGVCRSEKWRIAVGSTIVEPGDRVIGICKSTDLPDLQKLILG